jgi:putative endonuclease
VKKYYVYILASKKNGTLYTGITSDLVKRIHEHKQEHAESFTKKYDVRTLVHFDVFEDAENAIKHEKKIKKWPRQWKINTIEKNNPDWNDLYEQICK